MSPFVNYRFAKDLPLPALDGCLYEYVVGMNGVFVRARRPGLAAMVPVACPNKTLNGLAIVASGVRMDFPLIPQILLSHVLMRAWASGTVERLFYFLPNPWRVVIPAQHATATSVRPDNPYSPESRLALVELHSHHHMKPFFSTTDDQDETGFRIYSVIGNLHERPLILTRVGIYGHFWTIPSSTIYHLPMGIEDGLEIGFPDEEPTYDYGYDIVK